MKGGNNMKSTILLYAGAILLAATAHPAAAEFELHGFIEAGGGLRLRNVGPMPIEHPESHTSAMTTGSPPSLAPAI